MMTTTRRRPQLRLQQEQPESLGSKGRNRDGSLRIRVGSKGGSRRGKGSGRIRKVTRAVVGTAVAVGVRMAKGAAQPARSEAGAGLAVASDAAAVCTYARDD